MTFPGPISFERRIIPLARGAVHESWQALEFFPTWSLTTDRRLSKSAALRV